MVSPRFLEMLNGNYANLFIVGAAFQALVFLVLLKMADSLEPVASLSSSSSAIESE
jgi:hypothetical protein